ncbi:hypothetical protein MKW94_014723, partial [Papaver nudicaule]|nr:hypothetical protein [Papaver nudicaule]MCL7038411.1 hypothetical protein [Papaver nudicaule]
MTANSKVLHELSAGQTKIYDSGADEPQQQSEVHYQHPPPAPGILHHGVASSSVEYMIPHYEVGHAVAILQASYREVCLYSVM